MNKNQNTKKCSLCRHVGHTKRTCANSLQAKGKNTNSVVRVLTQRTESLHTVDLRRPSADTAQILAKVDLYREKPVTLSRPQTVDFAELVRRANEQASVVPEVPVPAGPPSPSQTKFPVFAKSVSYHKKNRTFATFSLRTPFQNFFKKTRALFVSFLDHSRDRFVQTTQMFFQRQMLWRLTATLLLVSLPFPTLAYYHQVKNTSERVLAESTSGFLSLQSSTLAALGSNVDQAEFDLAQALQSFANASTILEQEHQALQYVAGLLPVVGVEIKSRQEILTAGHHLALGNTYLVKGVDEAGKTPHITITDRLNILGQHLRGAIPQYEEALRSLQTVEEKVVPTEYQTSFHEFKLLFAVFIDDLRNLSELIATSKIIFGQDDFRRYLIVFQNHHELRPTGGFMGSYAVLDVQKGKILKMEIPPQGIYDVQGQLGVYLKSPLPLQINNPRFELQDSNWWPDFPASANKIAWFYEQSRGTTIDGVIAVNARVLEKLLPIIGTLEATEAGVVLDPEADPLRALQQEVEVDFDQVANTPKAAVGELFQNMMTRLPKLETLDVVRLLGVFYTALQEKDIQISLTDALAENTLREYGWNGEVVSTADNQDYLFVAGANILGGKSDAKIEQEIEHQAVVKNDGTIVDTVLIRRTHSGTAGEQFYGETNPQYVRVYVPRGAIILEAKGFTYPSEEAFAVPEKWYEDDVDVERHEKILGVHRDSGTVFGESFGKTFFGNWIITDPGTVSEAYIVYQLPFQNTTEEKLSDSHPFRTKLFPVVKKKSSSYTLFHQKQSGISSLFSTQVIYEDAWRPVWGSRPEIELAENGAKFEGVLSTDVVIGVVAEKQSTN